MACPGEGILTDLTRRLVDKTIKEVNYFRHFETYDREFKQDKQLLLRKLEKVQKDIEDAKRNNEDEIKGEVEDWIKEANNLIQNKAEIRPTRFGSWCPLSQYRQGKRLAQMILNTKRYIERCNFEKVAGPSELLDMKYYASRDFIDFESRKTTFKQLVEALKDGNHYMIGLQGMGGTGKTTLATQVGKQVEESKAFEKVIFVVVSNPPDVNKIRGDIARQLGLRLEEREEVDRSKLLWSIIYNKDKKLLIILDDVWGELNLAEIGIPSGLDHKNCYVLITTRHSKVCRAMRCQQIVNLRTLDDYDALQLFLFHARSDDDSSRNELEGLARDFLKECGGLPVAIVALASTLRNRHVGELNVVLAALQKSKLFIDVDEDLVEVYSCLRLSYDYLHNERAQKLFLLCSIFPEDYEFPIDLISRLGIGSRIFEETDDYCAPRSQALTMKNKLIDSSLLQKVGEKECVKMHDLVREVAQWIAKEDIQVIRDSRTTLETNKRFVFWSTDDFPNQFDGTKVEILLLWISGNVLVNDPNAFFAGMSRLKILLLLGEYGRKFPSSSLSHSLLSLKNIHTLILDGWELGDISILKNIESLVTLEFKNCLIIELPMNIMELKKLRWLGLRKCEIQRNNPFEVTKRCSQLEEFYFVGNYNVKDWNTEDDKEIEDEIAHDISLTELQIFSIAYDGFERFSKDDNGLLRCFNPEHIKHLIPDALFKYLVRSAEVLELGKIGQTRWKNLAPDIIPMENGGMDNLIKLYLYEWDDFECLVDNSKYPYSTTKSFSKMVELRLNGVGVKRLYQGAMPSSFLLRLQILKLSKCMKLQNIFFDENIKLPYLKVLTLIGCPMFQPSIFQRSVAQSLERLEELVIRDCEKLECLIAYEEMIDVGSQENHSLLFQKLKSLQITNCGKLEMVFSLLLPGDFPKLKDLYIDDCRELKYIFGEYRDVGQVLQQEIILPLLTQVRLFGVPSFISIIRNCHKCVLRPPQVLKEDSMVKQESSKTSAFSWAHGCCFLAPTKDTNIGVPHATMKHHTISQGSSKGMETVNTAECLMRHPLILQNIRKMTLSDCSKLKSLFSVSIATTMILLETLYIEVCEELKDIITNEAEDDDHLNCTSIFPKLQSLAVYGCHKLEFIFPSTLSGGLQKLKSIHIDEADELKHVFGKYNEEECVSSDNENDEPHIHLPALETLSLLDIPNMISIGIKRYQQKCQSLQIVEAPKEIKKHMQDVTSERAKESELQEIVNVETSLTPYVGFQYFLSFHNLKTLVIRRNNKLKTLFSISACINLPQLSELYIGKCEELVNVVEDDSNDHSSIFPKLEDLSVKDCNKLEFIFPLSFFGSLQKLNYLSIKEAAELKYIFGNESDDLHIHLPGTLKRLSFVGVPKIMNKLLAKKYHVSFLSLQSIKLGDLQEFNGRSFLDLMAYLQKKQLNKKVPKDLIKIINDVQKLTELGLRDSKIEEVLNLEGVEIEGTLLTLSLEAMQLKDLCELRHICKGPKYILSLPNLGNLDIKACKNLRVIFNVSIVKSLPQLSRLSIEDCDELADIIEESDEDHLHQICFPKLERIYIERCNSLKCLFSISTCGMFPKLESLEIEEAYELKQVFTGKQDDMQKMTKMEEVFPELSRVTLIKLPLLVTICMGIDFQTLYCKVHECPKYQGTNHIQEGSKNGDSENLAATNALLDFVESMEETVKEVDAKDPTPALGQQSPKYSTAEPQMRTTSLGNYEKSEKELGRVVPDPASRLVAKATTSSASQELEDEHKTIESTTQFQHEDFTETKTTTEASHKINTPLDDYSIDAILKEGSEQGPTLEDVGVTDLKPGNSSSKEKRLKEIEAKAPTQALKEQASKVSIADEPQLRRSPLQVANMKETHEQVSEEDDAAKEATIAIQSTDLESRMQTRRLEETEKEAVRTHPSQLSMASASTNSKSSKEAMKTTVEEVVSSMASTNKEERARAIEGKDATLALEEQAPKGLTVESQLRTPLHSIGDIQGDTVATKAKTDTFFIYSQAEGSQSGPSTMCVESIQEETTIMEAKIDTSSYTMTAKDTTDTNVQEGPKSEKAEMANLLTNSCDIKANIPMEDNTNIPNVIPSSYHQSQTGAAGCSPILEIGEIFQLVELKDGETALLAKALELYPQLRLSRGQRTHPIISFSYRVLVDILAMLATKTPYTITASDRTTLEANLGAATFLGFDKDWIELVRAKVFGIDRSDVLVAEEKISVMEKELEKCDKALECMQKKRMEAKEKLAMAQNEFDAVDIQLFDLLENRRNLVMKMTEFRKITSAKDKPFGI